MSVPQIYEWARHRPDKHALLYNDVPLTYAELARAIAAMRGFLATFDLPPDGVAVVLVKNLRAAWIILLALQERGLTTVAPPSAQQGLGLALRDVACVVTWQAEEAIDIAAQAWPGVTRIAVPPQLGERIESGEFPRREARTPGGHILLTSGTTGTYKKVLRSGVHAEALSVKLAQVRGFHPGMVYHATNLGLWTASGFAQPRATWTAGGCTVFDQRADFLQTLFRHPITHVTLLPPDLLALLKMRSPDAPRQDQLTIHCGGGFLTLDAAEQAAGKVAGTLLQVYGATEAALLMERPFKERDDLFWFSPTAGRIAEIVDERGDAVPDGSEGFIRFRLTEIDSHEYLDNPEATAQAFRDGCFYPGDLAVRRGDGRIRIVGRAADVLNYNGQKFAAAPVEQAVQEYLGVDAVCLFATLTDDGQEMLVVALESAEPVPEAGFDRIRSEFSSFARVRIEVMPAFPRTRGGQRKIDRMALRRQLLASGT